MVDTTVEISNKVGGAEIVSRIVEDLKDDNEPFRKMVMDCVEKVRHIILYNNHVIVMWYYHVEQYHYVDLAKNTLLFWPQIYSPTTQEIAWGNTYNVDSDCWMISSLKWLTTWVAEPIQEIIILSSKD